MYACMDFMFAITRFQSCACRNGILFGAYYNGMCVCVCSNQAKPEQLDTDRISIVVVSFIFY